MAIESITQPEYRISRKGFKNIIFTDSSNDYLVWPNAVAFAQERGSVLQSLVEALAWRLEAKDTQHEKTANKYQATRTGAFYFLDKGLPFVAFDDIADSRKNIVIARVQEGYDKNRNGEELLVSKGKLSALLNRAEKAGRIHKVPEQRLELSLAEHNGRSEYGSNEIVQALEADLAESNAEFLRSHQRDTGYVWMVTSKDVTNLLEGQNKDKVIVRPVGLGCDNCDDINVVSANGQFNSGGFARGGTSAKNFHRKQRFLS